MTTSTPAGSGEERSGIEVRARTVDEAVARGLVRLGGLSRSEVNIVVVNPGKSGLLGFGAEEAVVRLIPLLPGEQPATETESAAGPLPIPAPAPAPVDTQPALRPAPAPGTSPEPLPLSPEPPPPPAWDEWRAEDIDMGRPPEPALRPARPASQPRSAERYAAEGPPPGTPATVPTEADAAAASEVVRSLLGYLGYDNVTLDVQDTLLPVQISDDPALVINIRGAGTERLLAHADRSLFALQFVARLILNRRSESWTNLLLDVNGDRAQRLKEIYHMAEQSAQLVEREGRPVSLPPMSPYERRVVHLVLKDHGSIATQSIGTGPNRKVTVRRRDQMLPDMKA